MAINSILQEVEEQIAFVTSQITSYQARYQETLTKIAELQTHLEGLEELKANAENLSTSNSVDVNINVTGAGVASNVIRHTSPTSVNQ